MDEFRIEDLLDENLIFMNEEAPDYETLLHNLSDKLEEKGYVKEGYADAVIRREQIYPTGLPTNIMKVAVPHAIERDYVLEPRVLVATLKEPVAFKEMGDGVRDVLAVCGSNDQLTILQKIVGLFSESDAMAELKQASTTSELYKVLTHCLSN